jgi:adenine-specific DNA methylase
MTDESQNESKEPGHEQVGAMVRRLKENGTTLVRSIEEVGNEENQKMANTIDADQQRQYILLEQIDKDLGSLIAKRNDIKKRRDELADLIKQERAVIASMEATANQKEQELTTARAECLDRIEHYGTLLLDAQMVKLRRSKP